MPFASAICDGLTSDGMMLWYETSKKTVAMPTTRATAYRCHICRAPSHHSSGSSAQRDGSHCVRPDHDVALAHPVDPRAGGQPDDEERGDAGGVSTPTSNSVALRISTASTGIASSWICDPNWLNAWPLHIVRKLRSCQSEPRPGWSLGAPDAAAADAVVVRRLADRPGESAGPARSRRALR